MKVVFVMKMTYGDSAKVVGEVGGEVVVAKAVINNGLSVSVRVGVRGRKVILGRGDIRIGGGGRRGREELVVGKV